MEGVYTETSANMDSLISCYFPKPHLGTLKHDRGIPRRAFELLAEFAKHTRNLTSKAAFRICPFKSLFEWFWDLQIERKTKSSAVFRMWNLKGTGCSCEWWERLEVGWWRAEMSTELLNAFTTHAADLALNVQLGLRLGRGRNLKSPQPDGNLGLSLNSAH